MQKERKYHLTHELLEEYQECALLNSSDLLLEATFLLSQKHYARAYFIGCASLEETGKGYLSFSARGRNLNSPSVQEAIKFKFEDHSAKLVSSLASYLQLKGLTDDNIKEFLHLTSHLHRGREKAMYVDVRENGTITVPKRIVRPKAATDCVRLAKIALETTLHFVSINQPMKTSSFADKMLCLRSDTITKIFSDEDFWWYYIDLLKKNCATDLAVGIAKYHDEFYCKGKCFLNKENKKS